MTHPLDNICWLTLAGPHAKFSAGTDRAQPYCQPGEHFYCDGWTGPAPPGWQIDPDFQGGGLARRLMNHLLRRQLQRGESPFLHVMTANTGAHALYLRMGFHDLRESPVRVVSRA